MVVSSNVFRTIIPQPSFRSRVADRRVLRIRCYTYVLLAACSVGVLVLLRGEEIHVSDLVEKGFVELASGTSLGSRGETVDGSNEDEGKDDGVRLHDGRIYKSELTN